MTLQAPDTVAAQAACTALEPINYLFFQGRLSLGQAGYALGLSEVGLMCELDERGLPMPYEVDEAVAALALIDPLWNQRHLPAK